MSKRAMTPDELEAQADALLAAADNTMDTLPDEKRPQRPPLPARAAKQQNPLLFSRSPPSS